jgi:hypothetical protein
MTQSRSERQTRKAQKANSCQTSFVKMRRVIRMALLLGFSFLLISWTAMPPYTRRGTLRNIDLRTENRLIIPRPRLDKMLDISTANSICKGLGLGLERIGEVAGCISYLAANQEEVLVHRAMKRPEGEVPRQRHSDSIPAETLILHTYWSGAPTWRVEFFIQSYLFTQNLAHSQLCVWLDEDMDPEVLRHWRDSETGERLQPFVDSGHLLIMPWCLPQRIRIPSNIDHTDGIGYLRRKNKYLYSDAEFIADGVIRDPTGEVWVLFVSRYTQAALNPVARSDIHRFVVLHLYGGIYLDMDVLLLHDMRPLWNPDVGFAERWSVYDGQGDINTAVLSLPAMSEISSYFLRTGMRLDLNFHPRVLGNMAQKDGRLKEIHVFESAFFDPAWPEQQHARDGPSTTPCFTKFQNFFEMAVQNGGLGRSTERGNRTKPSETEGVANFLRGAYAYHIHNQVRRLCTPSFRAPDPDAMGSGRLCHNQTRGLPPLEQLMSSSSKGLL